MKGIIWRLREKKCGGGVALSTVNDDPGIRFGNNKSSGGHSRKKRGGIK